MSHVCGCVLSFFPDLTGDLKPDSRSSSLAPLPHSPTEAPPLRRNPPSPNGSHRLLQVLKERYKCEICLERATNPFTIPCQHTFCNDCIKVWWEDKTRLQKTCPVCRQQAPFKMNLVGHKNHVGAWSCPEKNCFVME